MRHRSSTVRGIHSGWRLEYTLLVGASSLVAACATHAPTAATAPTNASTAALRPCGCIDDNGNVVTTPTIVQSSGSARLDEGALNLAQASPCRKPEQGQPVDPTSLPHCVLFRIRFEQAK
jgi:hypothetical protein